MDTASSTVQSMMITILPHLASPSRDPSMAGLDDSGCSYMLREIFHAKAALRILSTQAIVALLSPLNPRRTLKLVALFLLYCRPRSLSAENRGMDLQSR